MAKLTAAEMIEAIKELSLIHILILCIVALLVFIPLLWLVVSSFKSDADVIRWPPAFLPKEWLTSQYEYVIEAIPILSMLKNTVVFAGSVTLVSQMCIRDRYTMTEASAS